MSNLDPHPTLRSVDLARENEQLRCALARIAAIDPEDVLTTPAMKDAKSRDYGRGFAYALQLVHAELPT